MEEEAALEEIEKEGLATGGFFEEMVISVLML